MGTKEDKQYVEDILAVLDKALAEGPWDKTLFLRATGQKLRDLRKQFLEESGMAELFADTQDSNQSILDNFSQRTGQREVYISLYNTHGGSIESWERLLVTLNRQSISRPIYAEEAAVRSFIRSKTYREREAYVAVYVNKDDIIPNDPKNEPVDRVGNGLIVLKERAVKLSNVARFVHTTGFYTLKDKQLIRQGNVDYQEAEF